MENSLSAEVPRYTYADYLQWFDDVRCELIDGFKTLFLAAPTRIHQRISIALLAEIRIYFKKKPCHVYHAPFDVRLSKKSEKEDKKIDTVVQPDICVICDLSKLDDRGCLGSPDFIIEILSPATTKRDLKIKYQLYEENGVREYWVVYPNERIVSVFLLNEGGKYEKIGDFFEDDKVKVNIFNDLEIDLSEVFEN